MYNVHCQTPHFGNINFKMSNKNCSCFVHVLSLHNTQWLQHTNISHYEPIPETFKEHFREDQTGVDSVKPKEWVKYYLKIGYQEQCRTVLPHLDLYRRCAFGPSCTLSTLNSSILIMVYKVRFMMFLQKMVDSSRTFILLSI